jgi:hypothetical protein
MPTKDTLSLTRLSSLHCKWGENGMYSFNVVIPRATSYLSPLVYVEPEGITGRCVVS